MEGRGRSENERGGRGGRLRATRELRGERDNARNNARCTQARKATHGLDGQHQDVDRTPVEESVRMTEDRDKWRKYLHGVANRRIEDGLKNRTEQATGV